MYVGDAEERARHLEHASDVVDDAHHHDVLTIHTDDGGSDAHAERHHEYGAVLEAEHDAELHGEEHRHAYQSRIACHHHVAVHPRHGACHVDNSRHIDTARELEHDDEQGEEGEAEPQGHEVAARHDTACVGYLFRSLVWHLFSL